MYTTKLSTEASKYVGEVLKVDPNDLGKVTSITKGMTNNSYLLTCNGEKYVLRIPRVGLEKIVDRSRESDIYMALKEHGFCSHVIHIDKIKGYMLSRYLEGLKGIESSKEDKVNDCMMKLRKFHEKSIKVDHTFNLFETLERYELLRNGNPSNFKDYELTKSNSFELKEYIDKQPKEHTLCHIDAVIDNFVYSGSHIKMIDWEYAGMQDPHIDIAMFAIYYHNDKDDVDQLIKMYFRDTCEDAVRIKIYCYIAVCGLLWSNWCEVMKMCGTEYDDYASMQYRYAKDFYQIALREM